MHESSVEHNKKKVKDIKNESIKAIDDSQMMEARWRGWRHMEDLDVQKDMNRIKRIMKSN